MVGDLPLDVVDRHLAVMRLQEIMQQLVRSLQGHRPAGKIGVGKKTVDALSSSRSSDQPTRPASLSLCSLNPLPGHFDPTRAMLAGRLPPSDVFELHIPAMVTQGKRTREPEHIQRPLGREGKIYNPVIRKPPNLDTPNLDTSWPAYPEEPNRLFAAGVTGFFSRSLSAHDYNGSIVLYAALALRIQPGGLTEVTATLASMPAVEEPWRLHPFYVLVAFGVAVCLAIVTSTVWVVWQQRETAIETAGTNLRNLSLAVADQTDRVIASVESAEDHLLENMARGKQAETAAAAADFLRGQQLSDSMRDIVAATPEAFEFFLADENGNVLNSSYRWSPLKLNIADRAYFRLASAHPEVESFVSEAIISRQSGKPIFNVVRRLSARNGEFKGVLLGDVHVDYLEKLFAASTLTKGGSITLFRSEGDVLVRWPHVPPEFSPAQGAAVRSSYFLTNPGVIRKPGIYDGLEHITALSRLPHHALMIALSEPSSDALGSWKVEATWIFTAAALGCLTTIITVLLAIRRFHDHRRLEEATLVLRVDEERSRAGQLTEEQRLRFGMALDNMNESLMMFDRSSRLVLANAATKRMFELEQDSLPAGMPLPEVVKAVAGVGTVSEHLLEITDFYTQIVQRNVPYKFSRKLLDGRQLAGNFAPNDNGWIITFEDMTEVARADERIAYMAHHDALTGLPNRIMLRMRTDEALAALQIGGSFAILCIDLDHFKDVNDTLGHPAGDKLLCEVAKRIRSVTRPTDIVARLGGDEFAIVAGAADSTGATTNIASRVVEVTGDPYIINGQIVFVGASVGVAIAPFDGTDPDTLMKNADMALYRAKSEGRGRFAFFETAMERQVAEKQRIERELRDATATGSLDLYYQPIVKVASRRVIGFEALIRWHHPTRGLVPPSEFIPIAEENGFILAIGEWALHKACFEAAQWPQDIKVAVNLSPIQFRSGTLVQAVAAALEASGLAPGRLELEITESAMMRDADATVAMLSQLKALGVHIAMDDFGTGYSSLAYLQRFPFDKVKIDRAFVRDIRQATNLAIVRAVADIAASMGITTLAEGVETEEQFASVAAEHCDEVQGFLFSEARRASDVAAMLAINASPAVIC